MYLLSGQGRQAELSDRPGQQALCSFGVAACLFKNTEHITIAIDCPPQPVVDAVDRDHDRAEVAFLVPTWPVPAQNDDRPKPLRPGPRAETECPSGAAMMVVHSLPTSNRIGNGNHPGDAVPIDQSKLMPFPSSENVVTLIQ
jgi:hypothetical protein